MKNYWRLFIKYFRLFCENLYKLYDIFIAFFLVFFLFGLLISSDLRERFRLLVESFLNEGWVGVTAILIVIFAFRKVPNTISKFLKAKGFNKTFWDDL